METHPQRLYTMGHGTLGADAFAATLRAAGVSTAVDVRRFAGSRRHPQFGAAEMGSWLDEAGITYRPIPELGGRRTPQPNSTNVALRNSGFRGYADYMQTQEFRDAFAGLIALARSQPVAIFCAETLWWRCHRRLVADAAVLLAGMSVTHLTPASTATHHLTPGVRRTGEGLIYDGLGTSGA
jgi:uncharacterized protein (DUF488 family)